MWNNKVFAFISTEQLIFSEFAIRLSLANTFVRKKCFSCRLICGKFCRLVTGNAKRNIPKSPYQKYIEQFSVEIKYCAVLSGIKSCCSIGVHLYEKNSTCWLSTDRIIPGYFDEDQS
jgi:hypothetical protein